MVFVRVTVEGELQSWFLNPRAVVAVRPTDNKATCAVDLADGSTLQVRRPVPEMLDLCQRAEQASWNQIIGGGVVLPLPAEEPGKGRDE